MADRPFRNPLLAKLNKTSHYTIRSAWEGLEYLLRYWPADRSISYKIALHVCRDAVDGWVSPERARKALKRALDAAGLSIPKAATIIAGDALSGKAGAVDLSRMRMARNRHVTTEP